MDWLFICLALVPAIFCPRFIFNGFALPQTLAVSLLSAASMVVGVWKGQFYFSTPTYLIIIFLIYTFLVTLRTNPIHNAKKEMGLQVSLLVLFLIISSYVTAKSIEFFIVSTSIVCGLISLYAIGQTMGIDPFFPNKIKQGGPTKNAIGSIGNPNFLSSYLSAIFWLTIYAGVNYHKLFFLSSSIVLFALYKTKSRAGQVAIFGSLIFFLLYCAKMNWLPYSDFIFIPGLILVVLFFIFIALLLKIKWQTFWHSKIDPDAKQRVWFASFRYRLCYWLVAWHLIKKKWLFGWGLWSYRKEVYEGQAEMNEKYPGFMDKDRYITPQPRECHNDWIEHIFEYGLVGAGIFFAFLGLIVFDGLQISTISISNLILLTNLISIIINATFFFALRIPSTSVYFWTTCAIILALSGGTNHIYMISIPWWICILLVFLIGFFLWECVIVRVIASRYFLLSMFTNGMERYAHLCKALLYLPNDTALRTHATIATADYAPVASSIHSMKAMEHFDGSITQWAVYCNYVLAHLKGYRNFFDTMTYYLKRGHYLLNYFTPINQFLTGKESISLKSQYKEGAEMRIIDEVALWKIRTFVSNMDGLNKDVIIQKQQMENIQLGIQNTQQKFELAKANIENLVLYEKKRMNIPDHWIFDAEEGIFKDPAIMSADELKKCELEG